MSAEAETLALRIVEGAQEEHFGEVRGLFWPWLRVMMSATVLEGASTAEADRRGRLADVGVPLTGPVRAGLTTVRVPLHYERSSATLVVGVGHRTRQPGRNCCPGPPRSRSLPAIRRTARCLDDFRKTTTWRSPGQLSIPRLPGPRPAARLPARSGPFHRDFAWAATTPEGPGPESGTLGGWGAAL